MINEIFNEMKWIYKFSLILCPYLGRKRFDLSSILQKHFQLMKLIPE